MFMFYDTNHLKNIRTWNLAIWSAKLQQRKCFIVKGFWHISAIDQEKGQQLEELFLLSLANILKSGSVNKNLDNILKLICASHGETDD